MMFRPNLVAAPAAPAAAARPMGVATDRTLGVWFWPRHRGPLGGAPATSAAPCTPQTFGGVDCLAAGFPNAVCRSASPGWAAPAYLRRQQSGDRVRGVT